MSFHLHPVTLGAIILVVLFYLISKKFKKKARPLASPAVPSVLSEYTTKTIGSLRADSLSKYSKSAFKNQNYPHPAFDSNNDIINRNVQNFKQEEPINNEFEKKKKEIWGNIANGSFNQTHPSSYRSDDDFHSKPERDLKNTPQFANAKANTPFQFENNGKTSQFNIPDSPMKEGFKQKMQKKDFYYLDTPSRIQMVKNESSGGNSFASPDTAFKKYESPRTSKASLNNSSGNNKLSAIKDFPSFAEKLENTKIRKKREEESDQETYNKKNKKNDNNPDPISKKIKKNDLEPESTSNKKLRKSEAEPEEAPKKKVESNVRSVLKNEQRNLNEDEVRKRNIKKIRAIVYKSSDESSEEENLPKRIKRKDIPSLSKQSTTIKFDQNYQKKEGIPEPSDFLTKKIKVQPEPRNEDQRTERTQKNDHIEKKEKAEVTKEQANHDEDELFVSKKVEEEKKFPQKEEKNNAFAGFASSPTIKPINPSDEAKKNLSLFPPSSPKKAALPDLPDLSKKIDKKDEGANVMPSFSLFSNNNTKENNNTGLFGIFKDTNKNEEPVEKKKEDKKEHIKQIFSGIAQTSNSESLFNFTKNGEEGFPMSKEKEGGLFEPKKGGLFGNLTTIQNNVNSGNTIFEQKATTNGQDANKVENKPAEPKPTETKPLFGGGLLTIPNQGSQPGGLGLFSSFNVAQPASLFSAPSQSTQQSGSLFSNLITPPALSGLCSGGGLGSVGLFNTTATTAEKNLQGNGLFGAPQTGFFPNLNNPPHGSFPSSIF